MYTVIVVDATEIKLIKIDSKMFFNFSLKTTYTFMYFVSTKYNKKYKTEERLVLKALCRDQPACIFRPVMCIAVVGNVIAQCISAVYCCSSQS